MLFIFDLDSTVANLGHRLHFIQSNPKDWDKFFLACGEDTPIFEVITIARALGSAGHTIVYATGRNEVVRLQTLAWLDKYKLPQFNNLYMRTNGDFREDNIVKSELLDKILSRFSGMVVGGVFEDRTQVVEMYRARGLRVYQVEKGDF